jgi:hypothetical protein
MPNLRTSAGVSSPLGAALARASGLIRKTWLREPLIFLAFVVLTAAMSWPWVCHLRDAVHDVGDPYTIAYTLWWDYHQTFHDPLHLFDATIFYPYRDTLAFSENDYGIALLFFPLFALGAMPLTVHSVATFCAFVLSGYGAFRLARTLTGSYAAAWVAGIVFAFIPYRFHRLPHLHYIFAGWIPLTFEALVLYARRQSWRRAAWLAAAFLMNALTCITWFVLTLIPLALAALFLAGHYRAWRAPRFWGRAAAALSLTLPVLVFFLLPYQRVASLHGFVRSPEEMLIFSARPIDWLAVGEFNRLWEGLGGAFAATELSLFPGLMPPLLTLAALLLVPHAQRRAPHTEARHEFGARLLRHLPHALDAAALTAVVVGLLAAGYGTFRLRLGWLQLLRASHPARAFTFALVLLIARVVIARPQIYYAVKARLRGAREADAGRTDAGVLGAILIACGFAGSLGPNFIFYRWVLDHLWIFKSQRVPAHWAMLCYLGLAIGAGLGATRIVGLTGSWRAGSRGGLVYAALLCAILFEQRVAPLPIVRGEAEPDQLSLRLKRTPMRGGLVELPIKAGNAGVFYYVLRGADHGRPLITAASSFSPSLSQQIIDLSQLRPIPEQFFDLLEAIPASYVVVHYRYLTTESAREIDAMLKRGMGAGRLRFVRRYEDAGRADLYAVVKTEPQARTEDTTPPLAATDQREMAFSFSTLPPACRETGFFVYRLYKAAFGRAPTFAEFKADDEALAMMVRPGEEGWEERLKTQSSAFVEAWVWRPSFRQIYDRQTPRQTAARLARNTGGSQGDAPPVSGSSADAGRDEAWRAASLLRAVEDKGFIDREFNAAFVTLHYFGLLHRDPDQPGFNMWVASLNNSGNYYLITQAFATSLEARAKQNDLTR